MLLLSCLALLPLALCLGPEVRRWRSSEDAELLQKLTDNSINLKTNFHSSGKECNIYDEAHFCQQAVIDQRLMLVAVSHKCDCPIGFRCPDDISETLSTTQCNYDEERHWHRCQLKCVPEDL